MPQIAGLLESALYVEDIDRAVEFFERVLELRPMFRSPRLTAFDAGSSGILLVFARGASRADMPSPSGVVPGHDGSGPLHVAFAICAASYEEWRAHLERHGVVDLQRSPLAARWPQPLLSRSRPPPHRARDAGPLAELLKRASAALRKYHDVERGERGFCGVGIDLALMGRVGHVDATRPIDDDVVVAPQLLQSLTRGHAQKIKPACRWRAPSFSFLSTRAESPDFP